MRSIRQVFCPLLAIAVLAGCAPNTYAPGPGIDPASFAAQSSLCDGYARSNATSFVAVGRPLAVAVAAIAVGVAEGIRERHRYQDCMVGTGWMAVDADHPAPPGVPVLTPDREPGSPVRTPPDGFPLATAAPVEVATAPPPPPMPLPAAPMTPWPVETPVATPVVAAGSKREQCQMAAAHVRPGTETWFMDLCMK